MRYTQNSKSSMARVQHWSPRCLESVGSSMKKNFHMTVEIMMFGSIEPVSKGVPTDNYEKKALPRRRKNRLWPAYVKCTSEPLHKCRQETRSATGGGISSYGSTMHCSRKSRQKSVASPTPFLRCCN